MVIELSRLEDRLTSVKNQISDHRQELKSAIKNLKITAKLTLEVGKTNSKEKKFRDRIRQCNE